MYVCMYVVSVIFLYFCVYSGLSFNSDGNLVVVDHCRPPCLLEFNPNSGVIVGRYEFGPLVDDLSHEAAKSSKCRFMACTDGAVFVVDLGLYTILLL